MPVQSDSINDYLRVHQGRSLKSGRKDYEGNGIGNVYGASRQFTCGNADVKRKGYQVERQHDNQSNCDDDCRSQQDQYHLNRRRHDDQSDYVSRRHKRSEEHHDSTRGPDNSHNPDGATASLYNVMQKQIQITELLVREQQLSLLPSREIPVFKGDPLHYLSFINAFELFGIEGKMNNYQERLFFLEQFTEGQPQELVRSCQHMPAKRGYTKARRLLQENYGIF